MYNCLQKKSANLLKKRTLHRLIASLFVFMMILTGAQAETYYWVGRATTPGGDPDNSWTRAENWSTVEGGTEGSGTAYPGAGDDAYIYGTVTITIDSDISIRKLLIQSGTNSLTSNFTTTLSGTGSLTVTDNSDAAINLTRCSGTDGVIGTLTINLPVTCSGTIQTHSGTTLNIASGKNLETVNLVHSATGDSPKTELQVNGTLTVTDTLNLNAMGSGATQLIVSSDGLVDAKNITFGSATYSNTGTASAIVNNGTIKVSNAFTIPDLSLSPYTGSGTIKLDGSGTGASFTNNYTSGNITIVEFQGLQTATVSGGGHTSITTATFSAGATISDASITTAEFTGAADISGSTITNATFHDDITLSGENTFQNLTATGLGGKTLTVDAEQTIQSGGTVTLSGTSTASSDLLTVTGSSSGKFTLGSTTLTGEYLSLNTDSSVVSASTGTAFAQNSETTGSGTTSWIVTSAGGHLWNGENGDWETAANWLPQSVPATTDEVIINSGNPEISSAVTVKSITVNGGGINLSAGSLTLEAISLATVTSVTAADSTTINITEGQEIDEKIIGAGKLVLASGKNYTIPPSTTIGIDIENNGSLSSTGAVTFSGDFTNSGTGTASFDGSVTVSKKLTNIGAATFTGGLSIAGDLEDTGSLTGAITFNGTTNQTFTPNNVIYPGITVDKSAGTLSVNSSLQVTILTLTSGAVSIDGNLTLLDGTDYQNYDFSSVAGTLTFTGGSSASPRVLKAATITNSSKISADYLKLQAQGSSDIILNSCQNISNLTLETSGNISVNGITADSLSIASGAASVKMKDTITLSSTSQDFIIDYPLLLTGDTTFSIIKDIIVQGTGSIKSDTSSGKNLSLTANSIQLLNGNALGDSTTTGALGTISINSNLSLGADTQFFSSQINFAGTGAKSLSGAYKLSATGNVTDNGEWTWAPGSTLLFNGSAAQTFKTNTNSTYNTIDVDKTTGKFILDTSVLNTDTLTITNCEEIHFTGVNEITTVANLSFTKPVSSDNNLTISNTSGNVSFADIFNSTGNLIITDASVTFAGDVTAAAISTKATTINCSKIQSSGNQNYTGAVTLGANTELEASSGSISFTSTVDGANTLKLTSSTGTSFGGNVGASTSLTSLEVNGTSNINCASITTSGDQTYNGTVNLEAGGTTTITGANTGAHIDFKDTINGSNTFSVTAASTTFENTVGATTALASLEITGTATINCSSIKTSDLQTYNDEIILQQYSSFTGSLITLNGSVSDNTTPANSYALTVNGNAETALGNSETISIPVQINGNLTNTNTGTASFNNDIKVTGNVTDNGNWNSADGKKLIFNGTGAQKFTPVAATIYQSILIDKTAGSFTTDTNALKVSSFADSAANASTITFATSTTIGSNVVFNTSNDVSFTNTTNVFTAGSPNVYHNITHEKGITNLSGTVTAANITLHKANLTGATILIAHDDVEFKNIGTSSYANIYGSNDLTITVDTGKSVTFNGDVGKTNNPIPTSLIINGNTNIKCTLISTVGNQVYNGDIAVYSNSTNAYVALKTDSTAEVDFSGDITESVTGRKLTINTPLLKSTKTSPATINVTTVELSQNVSFNSATGGGINLFSSSVSQAAGSSYTLTNNANLSLSSTSIAISPAFENGTSGSIKASSGITSFKSDVNLSNGAFDANGGTVVLTGTTASGTTQNLTTKSDGSTSFNNLEIKGNVTINNSNTIANLTANGVTDESGLDGAIITFAASSEQTVTGELKLKGKPNVEGEANHMLLLRSSTPSTDTTPGTQWKIKCSGANNHDIQYVDVQDCLNESATGSPTTTAYNLLALDSWDSGNNTNWNFPGMKYKWAGTTTSWNTATNWIPKSIPGKGAAVIIQKNQAAYPQLTTDLDIKTTVTRAGIPTDYGTIETETDTSVPGTLDLSDCNLTVSSITNNGLLKLVGKTNQISGVMKNGNDGHKGTVEYYSASFESFAWDGDETAGGTSSDGKKYNNLVISEGISQPATEALDVFGSTTIKAAADKTVTLDNEANKFTGNVILEKEGASTGTVTLKAAQLITLANDAKAKKLTIQSPVKLQNVTTTGDEQSYNSTVELAGASNLTASTVTFGGNVTGNTQTGTFLLVTANAVFDSPTNTNISIITNAAQTYTGTITLNDSTDFTAPTVTFGDELSDNGTGTSFSVTGATVVNTSTINTSGNQTYNGTVTLNQATVLTAQTLSPAANSTVTFTNDVICSASGTALTINANTNIAADLSITANAPGNSIDFNGNITDNGAGKTLTLDTEKLQSTVAAAGSASISLSALSLSQPTTIGSANASTLNLDVNTIYGSASTSLTLGLSSTTFTLKDGITINPPVMIETGRAVTCAGAASFNSTMTNNGSLSGDTSAAGKTLTFAQKYTSITSGNLTASSGTTEFKADIDLASTNFNHSNGTVNFNGNGTLQTLTTQSDSSTNFYNILISSPAKVSTASSFTVSGTSWNNTTATDGFTATAGEITFDNASMPATSPLTTVSGRNKFYNAICKTTNQNITFTSDNSFSNHITIGDSGNVPNNVNISSSSALTFAPELYCNNLKLNSGASAITFTSDSFFNTSFTNEASGLLTFNGDATYGNSFINQSTAITNFKKGFTGSGNASFTGDINLTDDADRSFSADAGHSITSEGNFIVNTAPANTIQVNTSLTALIKASNFVLYSGQITLDGTLESTGDIILLGPDYSTTDPQTGINGIYLYNQTRPSAVNYTAAFIAAPYNGELTALEDAKIKAGKNFYSNGITLNGPATGTWNIQLPKVSDSEKGFAEAIKTSVNNCVVSCHELSENTAIDNTAPAKVVAYECIDNSGNTNWNFDDFEIINAWTERDDAIFVEFNAPVRNLHNEITNSLTYLTYKGTTAASTAFTGIYSAADCQDTDHIADTNIELTNGSYFLYLKAPDSWNTDATGKSAGTTNLSSDREGNHKTSIPYIDIPRSLSGVNYIITNKWGKRLNNYSTRTPTTGFSYGTNETAGSETYVLDKTGPVLWSIRTGQELHDAYDTASGEASQHSYDSHNFLEFRYSEPVSFGSNDPSICDLEISAYSTGSTVNLEENVQVTDSFGAISGSQGFTSAADELTFTGLARLTAPAANQLKLYTGSQGAPNKYMNALYRTDEYSLRLSIAGWTDGTISDYSGNAYKKWPGYIEEASQFTGAKAHTVADTNNLVKDQQGNIQIQYAANMTEPVIRSDSSTDNPSGLVPVTSPSAPADLYSQWDLSSPVFTPLRFSRESDWGDQTMSEAIGNTNGSGSTLDRIDFHFFDNTPDYDTTDPAEWFTEIGWCIPGTEASKDNLKDITYTYCADIIGGARQFDTVAARRTTGGIRFSTKAGIAPAFKYSTSPNNPSPASAFVTGISGVHTTVVSQLFTGSSSPMRPANDPDGLYLGLGLTDTSLSVETTFAFSYNENQGYLTDLAGNRLRSKVSKTIDRTPPSFDVIISPIDTKSVYIIFVKQLVTDSSKIKFRDNTGMPININDKYSFLTLMPECFRLISIDGSGNAVPDSENQIDTSIPAEIIDNFSNESFTCIKLTTTKEIDIENLKSLYVQLVLPEYYQNLYPNGTTDPLTSNTNSRVTFIQDNLGNYMSMYSAHALSDFAINYVNPLYAYSSDMLYENDSVMNGLYEAGSWAVHYWNADQNNYGTLPAEHPVSIVADTKANEKIRVYLSPAPDADSISKQFNSDFDLKLRVWLPDLQDGIFRALSASNNTNFVYSDGAALEDTPDNSIFNISKETVSAWPNGAQVSFMFGLMEDANNPVRIYSNPYYDIEADRFNLSLSIPVPLYCLRMPDSADISTLDLWSFKLKGITAQRGGVTILNNVINASRDEKTVVVVDMPENGNLTVCVMTLDGNIITYLNRGSTKAGEYYYTWNGKNKNGKTVARGMYFVRVLGGGIDETRKVMVVKD